MDAHIHEHIVCLLLEVGLVDACVHEHIACVCAHCVWWEVGLVDACVHEHIACVVGGRVSGCMCS